MSKKENSKQTKYDVAMQSVCIFCLKEQYAPFVYEISHSKRPCAWCGMYAPILTEEEYKKK